MNHLEKLTNEGKEIISDARDTVVDSLRTAKQSAGRKADEIIEHIEERMDDVGRATKRAAKTSHRQVDHAIDSAREWLREHPLQGALIGVGAGFMVARWLRRSH